MSLASSNSEERLTASDCTQTENVTGGSGVHFRECDGCVVVLDLKRDQYLMFNQTQSAALKRIAQSGERSALARNDQQFLDRLIERKILATDAFRKHRLSFVLERSPMSSAIEADDHTDGISVPAGAAFRMLWSVMASKRLLRSTTIEGTVEAVRSWKHKKVEARQNASSALRLAQTFASLSPFIFTTEEKCRLRSVALIRFLTMYGISADWVFGIRLCPFGAHCWVEIGETVLNERMDVVREYRPIMVI